MGSDKLKIVHIATYVNGGAGTAAYRIHEALLESNIHSTFLSLDTPTNKSARACVQFISPVKNFFSKKVDKLISVAVNRLNINFSKHLFFQNKLRRIVSYLHYEWISLPFTQYNILQHEAVKKADIIHLHWVSGFLDYPSFFKNNLKPVVWTLHDMNPFQGLFHYKMDEKENKNKVKKLDDKILEVKRNFIQKQRFPLSIVCPSNWLLKEATKTSVFKNISASSIAYPINTSIFYKRETKITREELNIPKGNTIFLFVTQLIENKRKGFSLLVEAFKQLKSSAVTLLVAGSAADLKINHLQVFYLGSIYNNVVLSEYYSLADAFVISSLEDNLPNVMIEAMACGTPVLSFNTGGMSEVITDGFNGLKADEISAAALKNLLEDFIRRKDEFSSDEIRRFALEHFSNNVIANKYFEVYRHIL